MGDQILSILPVSSSNVSRIVSISVACQVGRFNCALFTHVLTPRKSIVGKVLIYTHLIKFCRHINLPLWHKTSEDSPGWLVHHTGYIRLYCCRNTTICKTKITNFKIQQQSCENWDKMQLLIAYKICMRC